MSTPKSVPVDVVMNGVYYGSYYLSEQIRVGKSRVNIDDLSDDEKTQAIKSGPELTGGYLLSMNPGGDDGTKRAFKTSRENEYLIESPDFDGYQNEAQYNYIRNYMQDTEDALFGKNFKNSKGKSYTDYIDLDSAADYYWVQEFSMNGDAYLSGSTYLYKKRNGKLFWGPLWDFDYVAWGDLEYEERNTSGFVHNGTALMGQMLKDKKFSDKVKKRWPVFKQKINEIIKKGGQLDKYYNQLVISQRYDHEKWGTYGDFEEWMEGGNAAAKTDRTYSEEKEALRLWIKERLQWVDANLNELTPKQYKITYKAGKKVVATETHYSSEELTTFPKAPAKKGYVFDGWYITQFGETSRLTAGTILDQNLTATAKYIKADKAIKPKNIYFLQNEIWIGLYNEQYSLTYDIMPQNAIVENLTWKSSKPSVATVGQDGVLTLRAAGTTKITASVKGGVKGTVTVHVLSEKESEELSEGTVRLDKEEVSMQEGQYRKISPVYDPTPCYQQFFRFMSLDESIATVTENGVIVGNKAGTTWVLVMADYGDFVKCKVTVTAKTTKPPKTTFTKVKAKKKAVTLKWKKKSKKKIAGYQIQYSTSKKFTKKTTKKVNIKKTKTTKTIKKLKSKKKYYFRIRTWKKSGKKKVYSGWSKVKKAKVK